MDCNTWKNYCHTLKWCQQFLASCLLMQSTLVMLALRIWFASVPVQCACARRRILNNIYHPIPVSIVVLIMSLIIRYGNERSPKCFSAVESEKYLNYIFIIKMHWDVFSSDYWAFLSTAATGYTSAVCSLRVAAISLNKCPKPIIIMKSRSRTVSMAILYRSMRERAAAPDRQMKT